MANRQKVKGDRAEREAAELFAELTGQPIERALGAGRKEDRGDLFGHPKWAVQVAHKTDTAQAAIHKAEDASLQAANAGKPLACLLLKVDRRGWRVVFTPDQWETFAGVCEPMRCGLVAIPSTWADVVKGVPLPVSRMLPILKEGGFYRSCFFVRFKGGHYRYVLNEAQARVIFGRAYGTHKEAV